MTQSSIPTDRTPEQIAQWAIDNRYPKGEFNKVSDFELYHTILDDIHRLLYKIDVIEIDESLFNKDNYFLASENIKEEIKNHPERLYRKFEVNKDIKP